MPVRDDLRILSCLDSIDEPVEAVVVLNAATDSVRKCVGGFSPPPTVVEIGAANLGAAYNAGIAVARGQYLLFMDSDCVFRSGTIRRLIAAVIDAPVVKGRVQFSASSSRLSALIERSRSFQIADHVNAYSPPLVYDRGVVSLIGGYHYNDLIHWEEDREFDFRLQLAGIPVAYDPDAVVYHAAQDGFSDLRSGFRYGLGEAIGQELGVFITPRLGWRLWSDVGSIGEVARAKGIATACYRTVWLAAYHAGSVWHRLRDPLRVRHRYPPHARRVSSRIGVPGHRTTLDPHHQTLLRQSHAQQGCRIDRALAFRADDDSIGDRTTRRGDE